MSENTPTPAAQEESTHAQKSSDPEVKEAAAPLTDEEASGDGQAVDKLPEVAAPGEDEKGRGDEAYSPKVVASGEPSPQDTFWARRFASCARIAPLGLIVLSLLMVWYCFLHPADLLYSPSEAIYITAFHGAGPQAWIAPMSLADGSFSLAEWPMFYWFMAGLAAIPGVVEHGYLLPLATSISAILVLLGVWAFTHAARSGSQAAFAAGVILLCTPIFAPSLHFVQPAMLACAFMLFALACFTRGWIHAHSWLSLPLAFIFTACAGMSGGPLFCLTPLVTSLFFLFWAGKLGRLRSGDVIVGFILMLAMVGSWVGYLKVTHHDAYLSSLFGHAFSSPWPLPAGWWLVFAIAGIGLVPWIIEIICVSWVRVLAKSPATFSASRHQNGSAMLWIGVVVVAAVSLFTRPAPAGLDGLPSAVFSLALHNIPVASLALVCLVAPLLGRAFVKLPRFGSRLLFFFVGIVCLILGVHGVLLSFPQTQELLTSVCPIELPKVALEVMAGLDGMWVMGGLLLVGGLYMFDFVRRYQGGGGLVFAAILTVLVSQPAMLMLDTQLATRPAAGLLSLPTIEQQMAASSAAPAQPEGQPVTLPDAIPVPAGDETTVTPAIETAPAVEQTPAQPAETTQPEQSAPISGTSDQAAPAQATDSATPAEVAAPASPEATTTPAEAAPAEAAPAEPASEAPASQRAPAAEAPATQGQVQTVAPVEEIIIVPGGAANAAAQIGQAVEEGVERAVEQGAATAAPAPVQGAPAN